MSSFYVFGLNGLNRQSKVCLDKEQTTTYTPITDQITLQLNDIDFDDILRTDKLKIGILVEKNSTLHKLNLDSLVKNNPKLFPGTLEFTKLSRTNQWFEIVIPKIQQYCKQHKFKCSFTPSPPPPYTESM